MPVLHLNVWTVFHSSLAWALYHFYQVFCLAFIFSLNLHPAALQGLLPWFVFTCCVPSNSSFLLTAGAFHWDWTNAIPKDMASSVKGPQGSLGTVLPDYCAKAVKLLLHWTVRILVLFISLVSELGLACDEVSAANALLKPACLVNCWLKPPFWWQSKYNLIWTITGYIFFFFLPAWSISHIVELLIDCNHLVKDPCHQSE